jgi:hypothetical protein
MMLHLSRARIQKMLVMLMRQGMKRTLQVTIKLIYFNVKPFHQRLRLKHHLEHQALLAIAYVPTARPQVHANGVVTGLESVSVQPVTCMRRRVVNHDHRKWSKKSDLKKAPKKYVLITCDSKLMNSISEKLLLLPQTSTKPGPAIIHNAIPNHSVTSKAVSTSIVKDVPLASIGKPQATVSQLSLATPSTHHTVESAHERACSNCHVINPRSQFRRNARGERVCDNCLKYEMVHKKPRPPDLQLELEEKNPGRTCSNCGVNRSSSWHRSKHVEGGMNCNACYKYEKKTGRIRPVELQRAREEKQDEVSHYIIPKTVCIVSL